MPKGKTTVSVTDTFQIEVDNVGNFIPMYWDKGGDIVNFGKYRDNVTKVGWKPCGKYFNNVVRCIHYGIDSGLIHSDLQVGEYSVGEYLVYMQKVQDTTEELLKTYPPRYTDLTGEPMAI